MVRYVLHFTDEKNLVLENLSNSPKVTKLISSKAKLQTQAI